MENDQTTTDGITVTEKNQQISRRQLSGIEVLKKLSENQKEGENRENDIYSTDSLLNGEEKADHLVGHSTSRDRRRILLNALKKGAEARQSYVRRKKFTDKNKNQKKINERKSERNTYKRQKHKKAIRKKHKKSILPENEKMKVVSRKWVNELIRVEMSKEELTGEREGKGKTKGNESTLKEIFKSNWRQNPEKLYVNRRLYLELMKRRRNQVKVVRHKRVNVPEKFQDKVSYNTKALLKNVTKGMAIGTGRKIKDTYSRELESQDELGTDTARLMLDVPEKAVRGVNTMIHLPGQVYNAGKGIYNVGKNVRKVGKSIYRTGHNVVRGVKAAQKGFSSAKNWTRVFIRSQQKMKMLKETLQQAARAAGQAAKAIIRAALKIIMFIIKGLAVVGLPVLIVAAVLICIVVLVAGILTFSMAPYLDYYSMDVAKRIWDKEIGDYQKWAADYKEDFIENECVTDCDYDHNDVVKSGYYIDGYQTSLDNRLLFVYVAAYAKYGDITIVGEVDRRPYLYNAPIIIKAKEIEGFMEDCIRYLCPQDEALITGNEERFDEKKCQEEKDEDGDYQHEHEYGEWRLRFTLRNETQLLEYLDFDDIQLETYYDMVAEFTRQMQEETEKEIALKGFSLLDYFEFFGGSSEAGDILGNLLESGEIELNDITEYAVQFVGNPYVWGGNSLTEGTDCSGFVKLVYEHFGVTGIPRVSREQANTGKLISSLAEARPGDLIFYGSPVHHVAMYLGNGMIVHASNHKPYPKGGIKISSASYNSITCIRRWVE